MKADQGNEFLLYHLEEMVLGGSYPLENPLHSESYLETMKLIVEKYKKITFGFKSCYIGPDLLLSYIKLDDDDIVFGVIPAEHDFYFKLIINFDDGTVTTENNFNKLLDNDKPQWAEPGKTQDDEVVPVLLGSLFRAPELPVNKGNKIHLIEGFTIQRRLEEDYSEELYWLNITYISFKFRNMEYFVGRPHADNESFQLTSKFNYNGKTIPTKEIRLRYLPKESIQDKCIITGIGIHQHAVCCLQFLIAPNVEDHTDLSEYWAYENSSIGIIPARGRADLPKSAFEIDVFNGLFQKVDDRTLGNHSDRFDKVYGGGDCDATCLIGFYNFIGFEDPEVFKLFQLLLDRISCWTSYESVISRYFAETLQLLDHVLANRDFGSIGTVFRLQRYLNACIHKYERNHKFGDDDPIRGLAILVKMREIWVRYVRLMQACRTMHIEQADLNCYHIAYLSTFNREAIGVTTEMVIAGITAFCQVGLMILLGVSVSEMEGPWFHFTMNKVIVPIIFIFTLMVVWKQMENSSKFYKTFTNYNATIKKERSASILPSWLCHVHMDWSKTRIISKTLDFGFNIGGSLLVVFFNFFLLAFAESRIEVVMNSVAALFIIELDDSAVFVNEQVKLDLIRRCLVFYFQKDLKTIESIYWCVGYQPFSLNKKVSRRLKFNWEKFEVRDGKIQEGNSQVNSEKQQQQENSDDNLSSSLSPPKEDNKDTSTDCHTVVALAKQDSTSVNNPIVDDKKSQDCNESGTLQPDSSVEDA